MLDGAGYDAGRMYRLVPGTAIAGRFPILGNGFAGPPLRLPRAGEGLRVACLGDSTTFGIGAGPNDAYPRRLSEALARAYGAERADVLNAGCPGYTTAQSLRLFSGEVASARPSILVGYLGSNNEFARASPRTDEEVLEGLARPAARALAASHLLRFLATRLAGARPSEPGPGFRPRVPPERFEEDLGRLLASCREAEASLLLVVPAYHPHRRAAIPATETYAGILREFARREGLPSVDLEAEFRALEPYPLFQEPIHLNRIGHRLLAARLFDALATDPALEAAFERSGLSPLRAFEGLAARAETGPVAEDEALRARAGLAPLAPASPEAAVACAVLSLGDRPEEALGLAASGPAAEEIRWLARSALGPACPEGQAAEGLDPLVLALAALSRGDSEEASRRLEAASRAHPYRPGIPRLRSLLETALGHAAAEAAAEEMAIRENAARSDPLDAALGAGPGPVRATPALARAAALLLHRDHVLGGPAILDRRVASAWIAAGEGRVEEGARLLEAALRTNPTEPVALGLLAQHREGKGDFASAESLWRRALEADPGNWLIRLAIARRVFERGEPAEAFAEVEQVLAERPGAGDAWALGIRIRRSQGDRAGEEALRRGARANAPDHPSVRQALAGGG